MVVGCLLASVSLLGFADSKSDYLDGVKRYNSGDVVEAMELLKRSADAGDGDAQAFYGFVLGATDLEAESFSYYKKSAAQGNLEGIYGLAGKYAQGEGVKKDIVEAWKLYQQAAARNHGPSIIAIAAAHISGGFGLKDEERQAATAVEWIRRAGEENYMPAIEVLIRTYRDGGYGMAADPEQMKYWLAKAASITGVKDEGTKKRRRK